MTLTTATDSPLCPASRMHTFIDYTNSILLSHYHQLMSTDNTTSGPTNKIWNPAFTESEYEKRLKLIRDQQLGLLARAASLNLPAAAVAASSPSLPDANRFIPSLPNFRYPIPRPNVSSVFYSELQIFYGNINIQLII